MKETRDVSEGSFQTGATISGRYKVLQVLGSGGMGTVYRVQDQALEDEIIALKFLNPQLLQDKSIFQRFRREVLLTRKLSHPNIVRVFDMGSAGAGKYFISMEYVQGKTLRDKMLATPGRKLPLPEVLKILHEICLGISHAHQNGIIHRDLKPDNILISDDGTVKIVDFGFAEAVWKGSELTPVGETVGTPYYMAPEQIRGEPLDHRCDIYAIGIIGYELVSGRRPFEEKSWFQLAQQHLLEPLPDLRGDGGIPDWLMTIVIKATAKDRGDRYPTADELARALLEPHSMHLPRMDGPTQHLDLNAFNRYNQPDFATQFTFLQSAQQAIRRFNAKVFFVTIGIVAVVIGLFAQIKSTQQVKDQLSGFQNEIAHKLEGQRAPAPSKGEQVTKLFSAISAGDSNLVMSLLQQKVDPNSVGMSGESALHAAARTGAGGIVGALLSAGADSSVVDSGGLTPLMVAIENRQIGAFGELLAYEQVINGRDAFGRTPLMHAIASGRVEMVEALLNRGALANDLDAQGVPVITQAVKAGKIEIVSALIAAGAQATVPDRNGKTPIEYASSTGNSALVALLQGR